MTATDIVNAGRNDLMSAIHRHFDSFIAARDAVGIPAPPRPPREVRWGRERVIAAIQRAHRRGEPLSHSRVDRDLFRGARNSFRTWRAAVEAAGIDYERVQLRQHRYSDEELLDILRAIHRRYPSLTASELYALPPHGNILRQRFGDVRAAASRIGIENWPRRAIPEPLSKSETLRGLRARAASGKSYGANALGLHAPRLLRSALHHFKSLPLAVKATGIKPMRVARREAIIDELFAEIRRRRRRREPLRRVDMIECAPHLVHRADFYFGGWRRAVAIAFEHRSVRATDWGGGYAARLRARARRTDR
jgi:hypothetical protein